MMRVLVSVRSVAEARIAAAAGVDFIDLKEPAQGALGGLPVETLRAVVQALRPSGRISRPRTVAARQAADGPLISATIGDVPSHELAHILQRVSEVAACGVDLVKVGVERHAAASTLLQALATAGPPVVPVFIADEGIDLDAFAAATRLGFPAVMLDTAAKRAGSLFELLDAPTLQAVLDRARAAGMPLGLAGALRPDDLPRLAACGPAFAGFRSAVCAGDRAGALDAGRLQALLTAVRACPQSAAPLPRDDRVVQL